MKPFEAKADENTCNECATYGREKQPPRKYYHFPVIRGALAETLVALTNTEGVREINIDKCDGELTVNFRFYEEWERNTHWVSSVPYELNKNKEE